MRLTSISEQPKLSTRLLLEGDKQTKDAWEQVRQEFGVARVMQTETGTLRALRLNESTGRLEKYSGGKWAEITTGGGVSKGATSPILWGNNSGYLRTPFTFGSNLTVEGTLRVGTLAGILKAAAGEVGAATIGSSLSYAAPTLNTIQDIRTSASPTFAGLTVSSLTSELLKVDGSGVVAEAVAGTDYPGLGTLNTFTRTQTIDLASATDKGLVLQTAATPTANLMEMQNSAGTVYFRAQSATVGDAVGQIGIGRVGTGSFGTGVTFWVSNQYGSSATNTVAHIFGSNYAYSAPTTGTMYALYVQAQAYARLGNNQSGDTYGAYYQCYTAAGADYTGTVTRVAAFRALGEHYSPGALTNLEGMIPSLYLRSGCGAVTTAKSLIAIVGNQSASVLGTAMGLEVNITNTGAGSITTTYGIKFTSVAGTTAWALYNDTAVGSLLGGDSAKSYFGTGADASITYDGTNFILDAQEVGSGHIVLNTPKTDTGDPAGVEGKLYWNTVDNALKMYCDGAWRTIASW